mgnify:CR=1 FL=1
MDRGAAPRAGDRRRTRPLPVARPVETHASAPPILIPLRAMRRSAPLVRTLLSAAALTAGTAAAAHAQPFYAYGLTGTGAGQQLVRYTTDNPNAVTVLGNTGASLTGIDFRAVDGGLYGFDGTRLYTVNTTTGAASVIGMMGSPTTTGSNAVGFDFNPVADRIRVVDGNASYRYNQLNGTLVTQDGALSFGAGGAPISVTGVGYTNNDASAATGTAFLAINNVSGELLRIDPPNAGTATSLGSLGVGSNILVGGFDIFLVGSQNVGFFTLLNGGSASLYRIDLAADGAFTGSAALVGTLGAPGVGSLALAAVPEPGTWALMAAGLAGVAGVARRRRSA